MSLVVVVAVASVRIDNVKALSTVVACGVATVASVAALLLAPVASAKPPNCVQTGLRTTQCQTTGGSTQIVTSPPENRVNQWYGYGWGIGFGGISIGGRR